MEAVQADPVAATEPLRQAIVECDRKLARHRAALEAGADAAMVAGWSNSNNIYRERALLVAQLGATPTTPRRSEWAVTRSDRSWMPWAGS
ncbi:hypothetical protein [Nocardia salmonicida]|uniref:hypothetical protein n=1 Tax=Nocardia salmonicida TaxID=53431 RepID=UPI0007A3D02F|nr:hypothetical protein [Nocardia salmonicida]